jgi:hypothetical protein
MVRRIFQLQLFSLLFLQLSLFEQPEFFLQFSLFLLKLLFFFQLFSKFIEFLLFSGIRCRRDEMGQRGR